VTDDDSDDDLEGVLTYHFNNRLKKCLSEDGYFGYNVGVIAECGWVSGVTVTDKVFSNMNLSGLRVYDSSLLGVEFFNTNLSYSLFSHSIIDQVIFDHSNLLNSRFESSRIINSQFIDSNLYHTKFIKSVGAKNKFQYRNYLFDY
jgi:uncharacterized protein YjbI with pentapeptide repeats